MAEAFDQVVRKLKTRVVRPDMRYVQAEPRIRVSVEDAAKVSNALAETLLDVHVLDHDPPPEPQQ